MTTEVMIRGLKFTKFKGGEHSGHHGHVGRPGSVGGSAPGSGSVFSSMPNAHSTSKEAKKWRKDNQELYDSNDNFKALADSVTLYTQGSYDVLKASSRKDITGEWGEYEDSSLPGWEDKPLQIASNPMANYKGYFEGQDVTKLDPQSKTFGEAGRILNEGIRNSSPMEEAFYRGMGGWTRLDPNNPTPIQEFLTLEVGDTFDVVGATSFSFNYELAKSFAAGTAKGQAKHRKGQPLQAIIKVKSGAKGLKAATLSPWNQQEIISHGRFKIISKTPYGKNQFEFEVEQEGVW